VGEVSYPRDQQGPSLGVSMFNVKGVGHWFVISSQTRGLPMIRSGRASLSPVRAKISPFARDLAADWKCWSAAERVVALAVLFLPIAISVALFIRH